MQIENSFAVNAAADRVYEFLLDVNNVVSCVPGAELSEVVDPNTFKGKVKIKVGPVTVSYNGTARITSRDPATRTATLEADGRETTGSGSAQATTVMAVAAAGDTSTVTLTTDFTVVGRGGAVRPRHHGRRLEATWWHRQPHVSRQSSGAPPSPTASRGWKIPPLGHGDVASSAGSVGIVVCLGAGPGHIPAGGARCFRARAGCRQGPPGPHQRATEAIGVAFAGLISLLLLRRLRRSRRRRRASND